MRVSERLTPEQIVQFLDDYTNLIHGIDSKSKHISLRVPENLLNIFKNKAKSKNIKYQSQIISLMRNWIDSEKD
jgi:predicted DNA binding CopG/RHH family protein